MFARRLEVQDESLLPEDTRSVLKRKLSKNKAYAYIKPTEYPKYVFEATCIGVPQEISVGQRLQFEVAIQSISNLSTTDKEPDVSLDSCIVTLIAQTAGTPPLHIEVLRQRQSSQRPSGPFTKDNDYRKKVDLGIFGHVPSAFNGQDVSQSHKLRLEIQFHAANNTVVMKREFPVIVHPAPGSEAASRAGSIVPRTSEEDHYGGGGRLPSYDEAMAGN